MIPPMSETLPGRTLAQAPTARMWRLGRGGGRVRLLTLILLRWAAVFGQTFTLLVVHYGLGHVLPIGESLAVVAVAAILNIYLTFRYRAPRRLSERGALLNLGFDIVQLTVLLYLTGGLLNPFTLLFLVPVTISAAILSLRSTFALGALSAVAITLLAFDHHPLPWPAGHELALPQTYVAGLWISLALGIAFLSSYVWLVANEARRMADALTATQMALAREQRLSELGGLAAAAAHELGTPLNTIGLIARDIADQADPDTLIGEDAAHLIAEVKRCREILATMSRRDDGLADPLPHIEPAALLSEAAAPYQDRGKRIDIRPPNLDGAPPELPRAPEILHALGVLIENATDFAAAHVRLSHGWDQERVWLAIEDDGPGIDPIVLDKLGEPYISGRGEDDPDAGMGLGVFIARTLLERTGGWASFANRPTGGASVLVEWRRIDIERDPADGADAAAHSDRMPRTGADDDRKDVSHVPEKRGLA